MDVRLHDVRHFVATQLLSAGVDNVRTVAGRLGHRNAATTLTWACHEGVDHLVIESSDETINRRDRQTPALPASVIPNRLCV